MNLVIITGTTTGLGRELARALLNTDHALLLISRRFQNEQIDAQEKFGDRIALMQIDLRMSDLTAFEKCLSQMLLKHSFQQVVCIFNAAVIYPLGQLGKLDISEMLAAVQVNLFAPMVFADTLLRIIPSEISLKLINISTGAAIHAIPGWSVYCASKAGARMFVAALEAQRIGRVVTVQHLDPGVMDTPMQQRIREADATVFPTRTQFIEYFESGKLRRPADVALEFLQREGLLA